MFEFPPIDYIVLPLIGIALGFLAYWQFPKRPVLAVWSTGIAFYFIRFPLEFDYLLGRVDRLLGVAILWTLFLAGIGIGRWIVSRPGYPHR